MINHLYEIPIKVKPGKNCSMPSGYLGAIVNCYVSAEDHLVALKATVRQLSQDNYIFVDVISEIREIDPDKWHEFLHLSWKELVEYLPNKEDVIKIIEEGGVFYGPFVGYKSEE